MASAFSTIFAKIKELFEPVIKQEKTITSLLIVVVVTLLNQLATKQYFKCPEKKYDDAGWSFMFVPGILLAFIYIIASKAVADASTICSKARGAQTKFFMRTISLSLCYAILAFLSWIIATLLFTETYACIKLGPAPDTENKTEIKIYNSKKAGRNSESKLAGLYMLLVALAIALFMHFIVKCILTDLPKIEGKLTSMYKYDKLEAEAAKTKFDAIVKEESQANGERAVKELTSKPDNDNTEEPKKTILSREEIEKLRRKLIEMYPRLENPLDKRLPYKKVEKRSGEEGDATDGEGVALL